MTIELVPIARCNGRDCYIRQPIDQGTPEAQERQLASLGWRTIPGVPASVSGPRVAAQHFCPEHRP